MLIEYKYPAKVRESILIEFLNELEIKLSEYLRKLEIEESKIFTKQNDDSSQEIVNERKNTINMTKIAQAQENDLNKYRKELSKFKNIHASKLMDNTLEEQKDIYENIKYSPDISKPLNNTFEQQKDIYEHVKDNFTGGFGNVNECAKFYDEKKDEKIPLKNNEKEDEKNIPPLIKKIEIEE
jgi:hypothetical protein